MREILRVNMTELTASLEPVPEKWKKYGGRALTDAIIYDEVPADADPLGPTNELVFAPGLLGGTTAPNGGRLSVGAKSPLTGGIKESNSGGQAAHALGRLGIAAVVVTGTPADPDARYLLVIEADGTSSSSGSTRGRASGNYEVADKIKATRPDGDRYATITIGPAGEYLSRAAGIAVSDPKGYPEPFRRSRRTRRGHGQQGPQGHRRSRTRGRALSSTPTRRPSSPRAGSSPRR